MSTPIAFLDLSASHGPIRAKLDAAWAATVNGSGFIGGDQVTAFEQQFTNYVGTEHCVGVSNGTDALELILDGLGIGAGDEVIVPANTFIATAEAVVRCGATPVFVDVDADTALITGDHVRAALTNRTAAVMAVHLYGQTVDMTDLASVADRAGIALIEDAAQAHGATWNGRPAGSLGAAAAFSFYPGKNLGAFGDGGAVTTSDAALAERIRSLANHGRSVTSRYEHDRLGRNARLDGLQAAVLRIKLDELDGWNKARRDAAQHYRSTLDERYRPFVEAPGAIGVHHLFVVRCLADERERVTTALDDASIGWGIHYPVPCHRQAPFRTERVEELPVVDGAAGQLLSLPMHPHLTGAEIDRVCEVLGELDAG